MTRWLITGGCGFIGRSLIRHLVRDPGNAIRVYDNLSVGSEADLAAIGPTRRIEPPAGGAGALELVVGDVRDGERIRTATVGQDIVVHLAGNTGVAPSVADPMADCTANVIGTLNCLEGARHAGIRRFVFASSGAPIGEVEPPIHEEKAPRPASPYGASKLAAEGYCSAYFRSFGVETVALRFGNVYGPWSSHKSSVVAMFMKRVLAGEPLEIFGDGRQTRDFIFVGDLVRAILKAVEVPGIGGETFQIATASETTVLTLAETLKTRLAAHGIGPVELRHAPVRIGDVRRNYSDTSKARRVLGWQAEVALADGLDQVIDWFLAQTQQAAPPVGAARGR